MWAVGAVFGSVLLDRLTFVEATGTNMKNGGVDWRFTNGKNMITLSLAASEVELDTDSFRPNPASGNPIAQVLGLGGARGAATPAWRVTRPLLEEGGHADLLVRGLQGGVDAVPVVPGGMKLLQGAEVSGSNFQD